MSKKEYTPREAALAILKKTHDLCKSHLEKADLGAPKGIPQPKAPPMPKMPKMDGGPKAPRPMMKFVQDRKAKLEKAAPSKSDIKGVHTPAFMDSIKSGTSNVGARMSPDGNSPKTKEWAKEEHKKKLAELKEMPKPNLGKKETK